MMLVDEGKLLLNDPVCKYIPAFRNTTVMVAAGGQRRAGQPRVDRRGAPPDHRPRPDDAHLRRQLRRQCRRRGRSTSRPASTTGTSPTRPSRSASGSRSWRRCRSTRQPGESYVYGYNTDILGYVVEKASGLPLDQFFKTRIFDPLKMTDTAVLPAAREARPLRGELLDRAGRDVRRAPRTTAASRAPTSTGRAPRSRAAPACSRPPATTRASCRCC